MLIVLLFFCKETESHSVGQEKPLALASPVVAGSSGGGFFSFLNVLHVMTP